MFWEWEKAMTGEDHIGASRGWKCFIFFYLDVKDISFYNNLLNYVL